MGFKKTISLLSVFCWVVGTAFAAETVSQVQAKPEVKQEKFFNWDLKGSLGKAEDGKFET